MAAQDSQTVSDESTNKDATNSGRFIYESVVALTNTLQGDVRIAIDSKTGKKVVIKRANIKVMNRGKSLDEIQEEAKLLKKLSKNYSNNKEEQDEEESIFCNYVSIWNDDTDYYLASEYGGVPLHYFVRKAKKYFDLGMISYDSWTIIVQVLFYQISKTIEYLHTTQFIAHRDLSLNNAVIDQSGKVKIIDFGLAYEFGDINHENSDDTRNNNNNNNNNSDNSDNNSNNNDDDNEEKMKDDNDDDDNDSGDDSDTFRCAVMNMYSSGKVSRRKSIAWCGKKDYMSDEMARLYGIYRENPYQLIDFNHLYDVLANDMWCLGMMLLKLLNFGIFPWTRVRGKIIDEKQRQIFETIVIKHDIESYFNNDIKDPNINTNNFHCKIKTLGM